MRQSHCINSHPTRLNAQHATEVGDEDIWKWLIFNHLNICSSKATWTMCSVNCTVFVRELRQVRDDILYS